MYSNGIQLKHSSSILITIEPKKYYTSISIINYPPMPINRKTCCCSKTHLFYGIYSIFPPMTKPLLADKMFFMEPKAVYLQSYCIYNW